MGTGEEGEDVVSTACILTSCLSEDMIALPLMRDEAVYCCLSLFFLM